MTPAHQRRMRSSASKFFSTPIKPLNRKYQSMLICFLDTETTGLEIGDHRIIEFYGRLIETDTWADKGTLFQRFNPMRSIMPAAQAVHHISATDLLHEPTWEKASAPVHAFISSADAWVAHNGVGFDFPFLDYEFNRAGLPALNSQLRIDTMTDARWATPNGKVPNLGELCFACGVSYDTTKAHAAQYDVDCMTECFRLGATWGFYELPVIEKALAA